MDNRFHAFALRALAVGALALSAGCTVHQTETPSLTGPSEFGLTYRVTATPDHVTEDGASHSTILVTAISASGKPASNVSFRIWKEQGTGQLQADTLVTGTGGTASTIYLTSIGLSALSGGTASTVRVGVEPVGTNYVATSRPEFVEIRLVPPSY